MRKHPSNPKLTEANKCIFVKDYDQAEALIEELVKSPEHGNDLLIHLRRIELASKVDKLDSLVESYSQQSAENPSNLTIKLAHLFAEQHTDNLTNKEALERYLTLLQTEGPNAGIFYGIGYCYEVESNLDRSRRAYEQCLNIDSSWHPAYFGLSQVYYQLGDEKKGDQYFSHFEELAPYNVYGNFETHRKLSLEFAEREDFESAEVAIRTLSEWWIESKGFAPSEIQLFERFASAKIAEIDGDDVTATGRRHQGRLVAHKILEDEESSESILYFAAKVLEEFAELTLALEMYRRILKAEITNPEMVQKIGAQFVSLGEFNIAKDIFEEAYKIHPDQPEIRFCLMVVRLKLAKVNVEDYLASRETLKRLIEEDGDRTEIMSLLMAMTAKYNQDPEVQGHMADVFVDLGHKDKARRHFEKMYELDSYSRYSTLKYASFLMQHQDADLAKQLLEKINDPQNLTPDELCELNWLNATYEFRKTNYESAMSRLHKLIEGEPWSLTYLLLEVRCLSEMAKIKHDFLVYDEALERLMAGDEENPNWGVYDAQTESLRKARCNELVFVRAKLRYLYTEGDEASVKMLTQAAATFNAQQSIFELLKLLNTNFDSPNIYWALGVLFREIWQLETASMWFDQMLLHAKVDNSQRARAYLELADCFCWRGINLEKAIEYTKLSQDLGLRSDKRTMRILAHGYLKLGKAQQADVFLQDTVSNDDPEVIYLRGLVCYRNGATEEANTIWKPLLTYPVETLRVHHIKQEIMKYYFDKQPYRALN
ncbi:MAG: hypothetical protein H7249_12280 [Chitinophagaceae bacterium]|nr:hypothetical protein [Oligoflexus sp.]